MIVTLGLLRAVVEDEPKKRRGRVTAASPHCLLLLRFESAARARARPGGGSQTERRRRARACGVLERLDIGREGVERGHHLDATDILVAVERRVGAVTVVL